MKHLLLLLTTLFIGSLALAQSKIKVVPMDVQKTEQLEWGEFAYAVLGLEEKVVIESQQDVYFDFSTADIANKKIDSVHLILGTEASTDTFYIEKLTPFLLQKVDENVNLTISAFSKGKVVKFPTVDTDKFSVEIKRYNRPMFVNDTIVFGLLAVVLALIFFTSSKQTKFWKTFYTIVPALLLCYLIPAILDTLGLISKDYSSLFVHNGKELLTSRSVDLDDFRD